MGPDVLGHHLETAAMLAVAVSDPRAAAYVHAAARQLGLTARPVPARHPLPAHIGDCQAVVHDGLPFDEAPSILSTCRRRWPALPIVLYVPVQADAIQSLVSMRELSRVSPIAQRDAPSDVAALVRALSAQLSTGPERVVTTVLTTLIPELPDPPAAFARAALRRRASGRRCTVRAVAASLGVTARTLRKRWPGAPVPAPKDLLDWTTLLFASYTREWSRQAWGRIARACGMDEDTLSRQRAKRLGAITDATLSDFPRVVLAVAEAVGAPRSQARRAIDATDQRLTAS